MLLAVLAATGAGCGARGGATPPVADEGPAAALDDGAPSDGTRPVPDPAPTVPDPPVDPPPDDERPADTGRGVQADPPVGGPTGEPVPDAIAQLFAVPGQVRVDETTTTATSETVEVVQFTGVFVDGDLDDAVRAFDAALDAAGLAANRDRTDQGAVYVVPIDERTLALGLVADRDTVFVSVDLLTDRGA